MNKKPKRARRRSPDATPLAIECDGSQLVLVLAQLRRQGRTPGEPQHIGPNLWRVVPGGGSGTFQFDKFNGQDRGYRFNTFTQGMSGGLLEY